MDPDILRTYYEMAWPIVSGALLGLVILVLGWGFSKTAQRLVQNAATAAKLDTALVRFFGNIARYVVLAATVIAALGSIGIETTSLLTIFASAGLAVGLALQGSLSNFASGVMLLFFRPFDLEDFVKAGGESGTVKDIGLFATTLLTPDNELIIIPNGAIMGGNITNFTRKGTRRAAISIGVDYGSDVGQVLAVLQRAAARSEHVLPDPAPAVVLVGFGASSVDYSVRVWATTATYWPMQHNVRRAIYEDLEAAGIGIPFQQVVVHQAEAAPPVPAAQKKAETPEPAVA